MIGYRILSDFSILASLSSISPSSQFPSVVRIRIRVINTRLYWPISVAGNTLSWIQRKIEFRDRGLFWINEISRDRRHVSLRQIRFLLRNFFFSFPFFLSSSKFNYSSVHFTIPLTRIIPRKYFFFSLSFFFFFSFHNRLQSFQNINF